MMKDQDFYDDKSNFYYDRSQLSGGPIIQLRNLYNKLPLPTLHPLGQRD